MSSQNSFKSVKEEFDVSWTHVVLATIVAVGFLLGTSTLALWGFLNLAGVHVGYYHSMGLVVSGLVVLWLVGSALGFRKRS